MPRIEIASSDFKAMKGTSSKSGKPYDMATQEAYLHGAGKYPEKFELSLQKDGLGNWINYHPGFYAVADNSFQVRDNRLSINSFEMQLVRDEPAKSAVRAAS